MTITAPINPDRFRHGFGSLRRMIAMTGDDKIERVFGNIVAEVRGWHRRGLDRDTAVAELTQIADAYGPVRVLGADRVAQIIDDAFNNGKEQLKCR
jgi:hypothetical protein